MISIIVNSLDPDCCRVFDIKVMQILCNKQRIVPFSFLEIFYRIDIIWSSNIWSKLPEKPFRPGDLFF